MGNVSMIEQSHNVRSVFQKAVYSAITKDLSGQEGCLVEGTYLHVLPLLLLTEYQSERFYWVELRRMIRVEMYLNDIRLNLNLNLARPFSNSMYVAITENSNVTGVYLPIKATGKHELRVEWHIDLEGRSYERISHTQTILIESQSANDSPLTVYSVPEVSYCYSQSPASLATYANSSMAINKSRAAVFGTHGSKKGQNVIIDESITISHALDLSGAAFFKQLLGNLKAGVVQHLPSR